MNKQLYIYGYSDYARLCRHYFFLQGVENFTAYLVDEPFVTKHSSAPDPVFSIDNPEVLQKLTGSTLFVAIGYRNMRSRKACFERSRKLESCMRNCISPDASVDPSVKMGTNNIVMPGAVIEPFASIGDNNIIWSNATVCHDSSIGSHNFIASNTVLGGGVRLGDLCFLGFSSVVFQGTEVADETLLGAHSLLSENTGNCEKRIGRPAKIVGYHRDTGIRV